MKTKSFNDLSLELKSKVVTEFATPLLSIEFYDFRIDLFTLNSMFIERYQNIATGEIERITEATFGDLDKYLGQIVIGDLVKRKKSTVR
jgi:hypothetical protein